MAREITKSKTLTFAHSFKPVHILSRIFGFMPFTIVFDSEGGIQSAQFRVVDFVWLIISIGIYLLSAYHFTTYTGRKAIFITTATLTQGARAIVIFRKLFNCLCIGVDACNRFKLVGILKKIHTFDEKVSQLCTFFSGLECFYRFNFFLNVRWKRLEFILIIEKSNAVH